MFCAALVWLIGVHLFESNVSQPAVPKLGDQTESASHSGDAERWKATADRDDDNIFGRVHVQDSHATKHFDSPEPYLEVHFRFINASVFDLALQDQVEGAMAWNGHPFGMPARVLTPGQRVPHGDASEVLIRQHVAPDTARAIALAGDDAWIEMGNFKAVFSYQHGGHARSLRHGVAARVRVQNEGTSPTSEALATVRRLLLEAADGIIARNPAEYGDALASTKVAWYHTRIREFLQCAFTDPRDSELDHFLAAEQRRVGGKGFDRATVAARFLRRLSERAKDDDLHPGFVLPRAFDQFAEHEGEWPKNLPV